MCGTIMRTGNAPPRIVHFLLGSFCAENLSHSVKAETSTRHSAARLVKAGSTHQLRRGQRGHVGRALRRADTGADSVGSRWGRPTRHAQAACVVSDFLTTKAGGVFALTQQQLRDGRRRHVLKGSLRPWHWILGTARYNPFWAREQKGKGK